MAFPKIDLLLYVCNRIIAKIPSHTIRLAFYRRIMGFEIGEGSAIFMDAWFDTNAHFKMGPHSVINQKCRLDNRGGLTIGTNVSISSEVCILTGDHDPQSLIFEGRCKPVVIEDYVFIGTRTIILPGVTLGEGCIVGAGSIVTKNIPAYQIAAGVPARLIGQRPHKLDYTINYKRPLF